MIAMLDVQDRAFEDRAARLGIFFNLAHVDDEMTDQAERVCFWCGGAVTGNRTRDHVFPRCLFRSRCPTT